MKTREVIFPTSTIITLLDAYENPQATIEVEASSLAQVRVPLRREVYMGEDKTPYYIYDGEGVLEDVDIFCHDEI